MYIVGKNSIFLLLAILALGNIQIHVSFSNYCNILSYIEIFVNEFLSLYIILRLSNINLYNGHI